MREHVGKLRTILVAREAGKALLINWHCIIRTSRAMVEVMLLMEARKASAISLELDWSLFSKMP
jgi:hypothetical protein